MNWFHWQNWLNYFLIKSNLDKLAYVLWILLIVTTFFFLIKLITSIIKYYEIKFKTRKKILELLDNYKNKIQTNNAESLKQLIHYIETINIKWEYKNLEEILDIIEIENKDKELILSLVYWKSDNYWDLKVENII